MHSENTVEMAGDLEQIVALAADVERWPTILPHYRWVTLLEGGGDRKTVEMAARRGRIPVRWRAVQEIDRTGPTPVIRFRHVGGVTKGMEVAWTFDPRPGAVRVRIHHDFRAALAGRRRPRRRSRHRSPLRRGDRRQDAGDDQGDRRGPGRADRAGRAGPAMREPNQSRTRVAITGIGAITPIGNGVEGLWDGVRRGESAVAADPPLRPLAASPARSPPRSPSSRSTSWTPSGRGGSTASPSSRSPARRMALDDAGLDPRDGAAAGAGIYIGSALGGVAFAEEQHEAYVRRGPRRVNPMLALSVFGGAASSNVTIELGPDRPVPRQRQLLRRRR